MGSFRYSFCHPANVTCADGGGKRNQNGTISHGRALGIRVGADIPELEPLSSFWVFNTLLLNSIKSSPGLARQYQSHCKGKIQPYPRFQRWGGSHYHIFICTGENCFMKLANLSYKRRTGVGKENSVKQKTCNAGNAKESQELAFHCPEGNECLFGGSIVCKRLGSWSLALSRSRIIRQAEMDT